LHELTLDHVRNFLGDAGPEPLLWEAKGTKLDRREVRNQVCGFANSHDGGYLILGADDKSGGWKLDGVSFPDEPPVWVSNIVGDGGVVPYPDGLDTKALMVDDEKYVAVVWIPPSPTPPCNAGGTVFERVSGKTIPVREPLRLAALFERGDAGRATARDRSVGAAKEALYRGREHMAYAAEVLQFGLGLAAVGYDADPAAVIFRAGYEAQVRSSISSVLPHGIGGQHITVYATTAQDSRTFATDTPEKRLGFWWSVEVDWHGVVSIYCVTATSNAGDRSIVFRDPLRAAWTCAEELLGPLGAVGERHLTITAAGADFPSNGTPSGVLVQPMIGSERWPTVLRGPLTSAVSDGALKSIERELSRAAGETVYEPG
jgi:hypothetical protein